MPDASSNSLKSLDDFRMNNMQMQGVPPSVYMQQQTSSISSHRSLLSKAPPKATGKCTTSTTFLNRPRVARPASPIDRHHMLCRV
ncbi:hypothetical protein CRV24_003704 [Beauveria bassiana]|nr:hypothetical protein CRV24_003704 [Beauveria bassiana]KAH8719125.1 hypothetical protein HC256_003743 [Beauveria bassiana]